VPDSNRYAPPEVAKSGWEAVKRSPVYTVDSYDFGILIFEVFNGGYLGSDQLGQTKNIPPSMHQSYKRLLNPNPKARLSVSNFLEQGRRHGGFFQTPLIHLTDGIENLGLQDEQEREEFLRFASHENDQNENKLTIYLVSSTAFKMIFRKNSSK
jgi:SCY1-like protein 1